MLSGSWVVSPDLCVDRRLSSDVQHCSPRRWLCPSKEHAATSGDGVPPQGRRRGNRHSGHLVGGRQGCCQVSPRQRAIRIQMPGVLREKPCCAASLWGWGGWLAGCVCRSWRGFRIRTPASVLTAGMATPVPFPLLPGRARSMAFPLSRGPWVPPGFQWAQKSRVPGAQ